MGQLLGMSPCPVCNYHIEGPLHFGGSTRSRLFLYFRYQLATCHDCHNLVSVLVRTPDYDMPAMLQSAEDDIATLEGRAAAGDVIARRLLPLHRHALEPSELDDEAVEVEVCTVCGSDNLTLHDHAGGDEGERFQAADAWVACPRCEEGQLLLRTIGDWDEIDSGI